MQLAVLADRRPRHIAAVVNLGAAVPRAALAGRAVVGLEAGSVNRPACGDDSMTPPHVSGTGSPSARYAIVDMTRPDTSPTKFIALPHANENAARKAEAADRSDLVQAILTGFARHVAA